MLLAAWMGGEFGGEWIHLTGMAEFLCCSPETLTTLLISYTPIKNKKFIKKGSGQYQIPSRGQAGMRSKMRPLNWIKSEAFSEKNYNAGVRNFIPVAKCCGC